MGTDQPPNETQRKTLETRLGERTQRVVANRCVDACPTIIWMGLDLVAVPRSQHLVAVPWSQYLVAVPHSQDEVAVPRSYDLVAVPRS